MKTYGKPRDQHSKRKIRGTNMSCPCCVPYSTRRKSPTKVYKKAARQAGKEEAHAQDA